MIESIYARKYALAWAYVYVCMQNERAFQKYEVPSKHQGISSAQSVPSDDWAT